MNRKKCFQCGLVNAEADEICRRCGASLNENAPGPASVTPLVSNKRQRVGRSIIWIFGITILILLLAYSSLMLSSAPLNQSQREVVEKAVAILSDAGFGRHVFALRNLASFRSSDNWWNNYIGHRDAYAATNFPFEVVTLYPEFFSNTSDDTERAAVLLHESNHLLGAGEERALEHVWRNKQRLGWIESAYGQSRVFINTKDLTQGIVPSLFTCGPTKKEDCTQ